MQSHRPYTSKELPLLARRNPWDVLDDIFHGGESPVEEVSTVSAELGRQHPSATDAIPSTLLPGEIRARNQLHHYSYHQHTFTEGGKEVHKGDTKEVMPHKWHLASTRAIQGRKAGYHSIPPKIETDAPNVFYNSQNTQMRCACRRCSSKSSLNLKPCSLTSRRNRNDELFLPFDASESPPGGWVEDSTAPETALPWDRSSRTHPSCLAHTREDTNSHCLTVAAKSLSKTHGVSSTEAARSIPRKPVGSPAILTRAGHVRKFVVDQWQQREEMSLSVLQRLPSVKLLHPHLAAIPKAERSDALRDGKESHAIKQRALSQIDARSATRPTHLRHHRKASNTPPHSPHYKDACAPLCTLPPLVSGRLLQVLSIFAITAFQVARLISPPPTALFDILSMLFSRDNVAPEEQLQRLLRCAWLGLWCFLVISAVLWMFKGSQDVMSSCLSVLLPIKLLWWIVRWLFRP